MDKTILIQNGRSRPIKNLGWLLRNWQQVQMFEITEADPPDGLPSGGCHLTAILYQPGRTWDKRPTQECDRYETYFASREVLRRWLNRSVFRGVMIRWFGRLDVCGQIDPPSSK